MSALSKHERHIRDAKNVAERLRDAGQHYEADAVARLCKSSTSSRTTNRVLAEDLRDTLAELHELKKGVEDGVQISFRKEGPGEQEGPEWWRCEIVAPGSNHYGVAETRAQALFYAADAWAAFDQGPVHG